MNKSPSLHDFTSLFETGDTRFLTFRGLKPVHQRIEFLRKHCSKISDTFIVVREANKKTEGYHFHAIIKVVKPPPKSWFKKGCHFNLQPVGRPGITVGCKIPVNYTLTSKELDELPAKEGDDVAVEQIERKLVQGTVKKNRIRTSVQRVLRYMEKDFELPIQYVDYIITIKNKQLALGEVGA